MGRRGKAGFLQLALLVRLDGELELNPATLLSQSGEDSGFVLKLSTARVVYT